MQSPLVAPVLEEERTSTAVTTQSQSVLYKDSEKVENGASQVQKGDLRKASRREGETSPVVKSQSRFRTGRLGVGKLHFFAVFFSVAQVESVQPGLGATISMDKD